MIACLSCCRQYWNEWQDDPSNTDPPDEVVLANQQGAVSKGRTFLKGSFTKKLMATTTLKRKAEVELDPPCCFNLVLLLAAWVSCACLPALPSAPLLLQFSPSIGAMY
jgi:hypothetical protein